MKCLARLRSMAACSRPPLLVDVAWMSLGLLLLLALLAPPETPGEPLGLRRFLTPAVNREWRVAQRFRMNSRDLTEVALRAAAAGDVRGTYRLTIRDLDDPVSERSVDVAATTLARHASYSFEFAPFGASKDHEFELEVAAAAHDPGEGIAFWATKGTPCEGEALLFNGSSRWGTIAYETRTRSVSHIRALLAPGVEGEPPRWLAVVGLCGLWMGMRFVLALVAHAHGAVRR